MATCETIELTYTAWDLEPFAQNLGRSNPPFRWDEERRFLLRCELDSALFHLYLPTDDDGDWRPTASGTAEDQMRSRLVFLLLATPLPTSWITTSAYCEQNFTCDPSEYA
jgi:hypothetical protein